MLVGRAVELERLHQALASGATIVVRGVPGIGRTALIDALALERPGVRTGRGLAALADHDLHPIHQAFGWPPRPATVRSAAPDVLDALGRDGALVLDDLHWADRATLQLVVELVGRCAMAATVRAGGEGDAIAELLIAAGADIIDLAPLPDEDIAAILGGLHPELLDGERRNVAAVSAGNPFLASVLARQVDLAPGDDPQRARRGADRAILAAIVGSQSISARSSLAYRGQRVRCRLRVEELNALLAAGLVVLGRDGRAELSSRMVAGHDLLGLSAEERSRVALRLATGGDVGAVESAVHLLAAGAVEEAYRAALAAAVGPVARAGQATALEVAALAGAALLASGSDAAPDLIEIDDVSVRAATALNDCARHDAACNVVTPLLERGVDAPGVVVEALRAVIGRGDRTDAIELVDRLAPVVGVVEGPLAPRVRSLWSILRRWSVSGPDPESLVNARLDSVGMGADGEDPAVLIALGAYRVDAAEPVDWLSIANDAAERRRGTSAEFEASRNLARVQIAMGHHGDGRRLALDCAARADAEGEVEWAIEFRTLEVLSRFYDESNHDDALSWLSFVRTAPARLETRAMATSVLATLLADRGAAARSADVLEGWLDIDTWSTFDPMTQALLTWGGVQRAWIIGDLDEAIRLSRLLAATVPAGYPSMAGTFVVWRWAELESGLELTAPDPEGGLLDCAALEAEGIRRLHAADHADAASLFLAAAESWRPILWRCALRSRWAAGVALDRNGERQRAVEMLEGVDTELDPSGCPALRPRVHAALRSLSGGTAGPTTRTQEQGPLSARERMVLLGVVDGLTSLEIARRLGISVATVNSHVGASMRKLGARTRIEAAAMVGLDRD